MKRVLFCNIAYMQYYDALSVKETPKHGGRYVQETGDAFEKNNFHICEDGKVRGFVETKYVDGSATAQQPKQLRIENIDPNYKKADCIEGVTVIFCAHSDVRKKTVIIGWYTDAVVYRNRPQYHGRQFNLECKAENACLLNEKARSFEVPRANKADYGFGQSNVWYAKDDGATEYLNTVRNYVATKISVNLKENENIPQEISEEYAESGVGKKILVNKYERNPVARRKCIDKYGSSCLICGFNAATMYGEDFEGRIEVHHIVPINEIKQDYRVDPVRDLMPVCPNCHMMLHTKMSDGTFLTPGQLRDRIGRLKML